MSRKQVEKKYLKLLEAWSDLQNAIGEFAWAKNELYDMTCDWTIGELLNRMEDSGNRMGLWEIMNDEYFPECPLLQEWRDFKEYMLNDYDGSAEYDDNEEDEEEEEC